MKKVLFILLLTLIYLGSSAQAIVLRKPVKGDIWPSYSKQRIEWDAANIDNIKIESSLDSGRTWKVEVSSYAAPAGFYEWEVPNKTSDSCFIRITDVDDPTKSTSNYPNNPFKIPPPGITIDSIPSSIYKGSVQPITWVSSGVRKVNIFVSYNNKVSFTKIADSVNANSYYFNWIVPNTPGNQCFLVLNDANNNSLSDTLKMSFNLIDFPVINNNKYKGGFFDGHASSANKANILKLLTLNNADSVYGSSIQNIKWDARNIDLIDIYYSANNGSTWSLVADNISAVAGQYIWKASSTPTNQAKIKIVAIADSTIVSISTNPFIIRKKELKFSSIDSSSTFNKGGVFPISWQSGGVNFIKLKLVSNKIDSTLKDSIPANYEMYNWIINPSTVDSFRLVLVDLADSTVSDTAKNIVLKSLVNSNPAKYRGGSFDGHASKSNTLSSIKLLYPNGGENLSVQNNTTILWKNNNIEKIKLELSIDSGSTWTALNADITGTINSFVWKTPNSPSNQCLIKVSDAADATIFDITDSIFSLQPKSLVFTTDSSDFIKETAKSIEWKPQGVDSVRIKYKAKLLDSYQIIKDSLPAKFELFNWILPASLGDSIWMRIEDLRDTSVNDQKTYFKKTNTLIKDISITKYRGGRFDGHAQRSNINKLIIRKPEANEVLVGGSKYAITWSTVNLEDSVLIEFTIDSGRTWNTVTRTVASTGRYEWTIPNSIQGNSINVFEFGTIRSASTDQSIQNYNSTSPIVINSSKCQIRAVDISAGNVVVGSTSNNFAIVASTQLLKDTISFAPPKTMTLGDPSQTLFADATSKRLVKFFIDSGATKATISSNSLTAKLAGRVRIGAYVEKDSLYQNVDTAYQTICINPVKPIIPYTGKLSLCNNDSAMVTGTAGFNQYLWSNNETSSTIKITSTINISLKVGVDGCYSASSDTLKFTKSSTATPTISAASATSFCIGGSVVLTSSSATGNQWFKDGTIITGATSATYTANQSGTYTVVSTNASGCASTASTATTVTVNPLPTTPTISAASTTTFCIGGSVVLTSSAATGNQWFKDGTIITSATNTTYTATQSGTYTVVSTNASGCASAASTTTTVTVNAIPSTPTISAASTTTFCVGGLVVLTSSTTSGNQWFKDGTIITGASNTTYTATQSGTYTVVSTSTSGCASAASTATTVTVNPLPATPTITAATATSFCIGGSVVLTSSAASGNQWFKDGAIIAGATNSTYTANQSGAYTVISTSTSGCASATSAATTVTLNPLPSTPTITATTATSFCIGGSVVLTSSATSGNQWFKDGAIITGATNSTYTANQSGNYTVVSTNASGCASAASTATTVTVNPLPAIPTISAGNATTFCVGGSVVLTSSAASGNQWFKDGAIIAGATNATYTANQSGAYTVVSTSTSGCASAASTATTVTVNPLPSTPTITAATATSFCIGGSVVLTSSASSGNQWFRDGANITGATNATYTANQSGVYTVVSTSTSGCASVASIANTVTVNPLPATPTISAASTTTFCVGGSVVLTSSATSGNQWFRDGALIAGATNSTYTANQSGAYTVVSTSNSGCASAISNATTVTVNPLPTTPTISAASTTTFCVGGSVVLTSSAASGNQWFKDGAIITGATNATYTATQSGVYTVVSTSTSGCASAASTATTVTVNPLPTTPTISAASTTTFCVGGSVVLTSSAATGNQWFKDGAIIAGATNSTYTATQSGNYTVKISNANSCESTSANTTVTVNPIPTKATISQSGADLISSSNTGNLWFKDADQIAGATDKTYRPLVSGYYRVQVRLNACSGPMSDPYFYLVTSVVNTNTSSDSYKLFPNPVKDKFLIDAGTSIHKISYQIFDANGRRILSNSFTKSVVVDLSKLNSGTYTILITNTKTLKQESKQIIKQ